MSTPTAVPPRASTSFTTLVSIGVLVIAAGLLLPRLLSLSPSPEPAETATGEPASPFVSAAPAPAAPEIATPPVTAAPQASAGNGETTSLVWVVAKLMFGLAIVAGVCIGIARWTNRTRQTAPPGILNALAKLAVDQRCVVHLVGAGSRRLLVGTDAAGVKAVLELPPK